MIETTRTGQSSKYKYLGSSVPSVTKYARYIFKKIRIFSN